MKVVKGIVMGVIFSLTIIMTGCGNNGNVKATSEQTAVHVQNSEQVFGDGEVYTWDVFRKYDGKGDKEQDKPTFEIIEAKDKFGIYVQLTNLPKGKSEAYYSNVMNSKGEFYKFEFPEKELFIPMEPGTKMTLYVYYSASADGYKNTATNKDLKMPNLQQPKISVDSAEFIPEQGINKDLYKLKSIELSGGAGDGKWRISGGNSSPTIEKALEGFGYNYVVGDFRTYLKPNEYFVIIKDGDERYYTAVAVATFDGEKINIESQYSFVSSTGSKKEFVEWNEADAEIQQAWENKQD